MRAASHDKTQLKGSVFPKLACDDDLVWELNGTVTDIIIKSSYPVNHSPKQQRDHCQRNHGDILVCELPVFNLPKHELPDWLFHQITGTIRLQQRKNRRVPVGGCA